MISRLVTMWNEEPLSPQKAAKLVDGLSRFESRILLEQDNKKVNGKSIMGLLSLQLTKGDSILVRADGRDETAAMEKALDILIKG